jgi:hypothetical protein
MWGWGGGLWEAMAEGKMRIDKQGRSVKGLMCMCILAMISRGGR